MSRSLHTDPYEVRAARRVAAPHRRRGDEARVARRRARQGGSSPGKPFADTGSPAHEVRISTSPARPGHLHPADADDIARTLAAFGPTVSYGLRRVALRQRPAATRAGLLLAALHVPGVVVLYEQPAPPWLLPGRLTAGSARLLRRAGAQVHAAAATTRVDWPGATLRDFLLFDGLLHEIGHHLIQHGTGKRTARVRRTADHERGADAFAAACRRARPAAAG